MHYCGHCSRLRFEQRVHLKLHHCFTIFHDRHFFDIGPERISHQGQLGHQVLLLEEGLPADVRTYRLVVVNQVAVSEVEPAE